MPTIAELLKENGEMRFILSEGDKVEYNGKQFGDEGFFTFNQSYKVTSRNPMGFEVEVKFRGAGSNVFIYPHGFASFNLMERARSSRHLTEKEMGK